MATSTLAMVLATMVDRYGLGRRGTNTGTVATSLVSDADLGGSDAARGLDSGCSVLIDGGTRAGDVTQLSTKPKLSTGLASVDPDFGASLDSTSTFIIFFKPLRYIGGGYAVRDKINQVLDEFQFEKRIVPITLVADGDMLASAETDWTLANATDVKAVASFPNGERVIVVTDSGSGGGYTSTGNIAVEENTSYYLETLAFGTDSSDAGELRVIDVTNSGATITITNSVIDRIEPERLKNSFTTPSGCEQVDIRLISTNASDVVSWAYVILRKNDAHEFTLADRPQRVLQLGRLLVPTLDKWGQRGDWQEVPAELVALDSGMWRYQTKVNLAGQSVWYEEVVKPGTLTAVTDTTVIPDEELAAVVAEALLRPLRSWSKDWAIKYEFAASRSAGVIDRYLSQNLTVVNQAPAAYPLARV